MKKADDMWQKLIEQPSGCPPVEQLDSMTGIDPQVANHVTGCPHCQAELQLLRGFLDPQESAAEVAAVDQIVSGLGHSIATNRPTQSRYWRSTYWLAAAAAVVLVLAGQALLRPDRGALVEPTTVVVRAGDLEPVQPKGTLQTVPEAFEWRAVLNADHYVLTFYLVAGDVFWSGTSERNRLPAPPEVLSGLEAGRRLEWEVAAADADGRTLARSSRTPIELKVNE